MVLHPVDDLRDDAICLELDHKCGCTGVSTPVEMQGFSGKRA